MIRLDIPGWGKRNIEHIVCDFNGTLAADGKLLPNVEELLAQLSIRAHVHICTADKLETVVQECRHLDVKIHRIYSPIQDRAKAEYVRQLGPLKTASIGNGRNDTLMIQDSSLGVAVIGKEGMCSALIARADIVCLNIQQALELLLHPARLVSTLQR